MSLLTSNKLETMCQNSFYNKKVLWAWAGQVLNMAKNMADGGHLEF